MISPLKIAEKHGALLVTNQVMVTENQMSQAHIGDMVVRVLNDQMQQYMRYIIENNVVRRRYNNEGSTIFYLEGMFLTQEQLHRIIDDAAYELNKYYRG